MFPDDENHLGDSDSWAPTLPTVCGVSHCGKDFLRAFCLIRYSHTLESVLPSPLMKVNLRLVQYMTEVLSKGVLFSFVYGTDIGESLVICSL